MFKHGRPVSLIDRLPISSSRSAQLSNIFFDSLLANDRVEDFEFDQILPPKFRALADTHWSPIEVARRIAAVAKDQPRARFVDIGSGAGKLCLLLALLTDLDITGIEQRNDLVKISQELCDANAPGRVQFIHGNMLTLDWDQFDIFYLYNPFQEHTCCQSRDDVIDRNVQLSRKTYAKYIDEVFRQLVLLKPKKKVITFHGYGGRMPKSLKLLESFRIENGTLQIWEKV